MKTNKEIIKEFEKCVDFYGLIEIDGKLDSPSNFLKQALKSQRQEIIEKIEKAKYKIDDFPREQNKEDSYMSGFNKALKEIINIIKDET